MASTGKKHKNKNLYETGKYNQHTDNSYNTTSVAYETLPQYYPSKNEDAKKERILQARREKAERLRDRVISFKFAIAVAFVFGCCILTMSSYARVVEKREQISTLKSELSKIQSENNALSAEIAEQVNLEVIEKEAIERLGMAKPQQYQIIYIDVPEQSYTVQYSNSETKKNENKGFSISDIFSKVLSIFEKD